MQTIHKSHSPKVKDFSSFPLSKLSPILPYLADHLILSYNSLAYNINYADDYCDYDMMYTLIKLIIHLKQNEIYYNVPNNKVIFDTFRYDTLLVSLLAKISKNKHQNNKIIELAILQIFRALYKKIKSIAQVQSLCHSLIYLLQSCQTFIKKSVLVKQQKFSMMISQSIIDLCIFIQMHDEVNQRQYKKDIQKQSQQVSAYLQQNQLVQSLYQIIRVVRFDILLYFGSYYQKQIKSHQLKFIKNYRQNSYTNQNISQQLSQIRFIEEQIRQLIRGLRININRPRVLFGYITSIIKILPYVMILQNKNQNKYKKHYQNFMAQILRIFTLSNLNQKSAQNQQYNLKLLKQFQYRSLLNQLQKSLLLYYFRMFKQGSQQLIQYKSQEQYFTIKNKAIDDIIVNFREIQMLKLKTIRLIEVFYDDHLTKHYGYKGSNLLQNNTNSTAYNRKSQRMQHFQSKLNEKKTIKSQIHLQPSQPNIHYHKKLDKNQQQTQNEEQDETFLNKLTHKNTLTNKKQKPSAQIQQASKQQTYESKFNSNNFIELQKRNGNFHSQYFALYYDQHYNNPQVRELFSKKVSFIGHNKDNPWQTYRHYQIKSESFINLSAFNVVTVNKNINFMFNQKSRIIKRDHYQKIKQIYIFHKDYITKKQNFIKLKQNNQSNKKLQNAKKQLITAEEKVQEKKLNLFKEFLERDRRIDMLESVTINLFPLFDTKIGKKSFIQLIYSVKDFLKIYSEQPFFNRSYTLQVKPPQKQQPKSTSNQTKSQKNQQPKHAKQYVLPSQIRQDFLSSYLTHPFQLAVSQTNLRFSIDYFIELLFQLMSRFIQIRDEQIQIKTFQLFISRGFKPMNKHLQVMFIYFVFEMQKHKQLYLSPFTSKLFHRYLPTYDFIEIVKYTLLQLKLSAPTMNYFYQQLYQIIYSKILLLFTKIENIVNTELIRMLSEQTQYFNRHHKNKKHSYQYQPQTANTIQQIKEQYFYSFNEFVQLMQFFYIFSYSFINHKQFLQPFEESMRHIFRQNLLFYCPSCMNFALRQYTMDQFNYFQNLRCQNCPYSLYCRFQTQGDTYSLKNLGRNYRQIIRLKLAEQLKNTKNTLMSRKWNLEQLPYFKCKYTQAYRNGVRNTGPDRNNDCQPLQLQQPFIPVEKDQFSRKNRKKLQRQKIQQNQQLQSSQNRQTELRNDLPYKRNINPSSQRQLKGQPKFNNQPTKDNKYLLMLEKSISFNIC